MGAVTKFLINNQNYLFPLTLWSGQASGASQGKAFTLRTLLALYVTRHNVRVSFVNAFSDFEGILLITDLVRGSPPCVKWSPALHDTNYIWQPILSVFVFVVFIFTKRPSPLANPTSVPHAHWRWNTPLVAEVGTRLYLQAWSVNTYVKIVLPCSFVTQENINWSTVY